MMMSGLEMIAKERQEQIELHKYSAGHDDLHVLGELVEAAAWILSIYDSNLSAVDWPFEEVGMKKVLNHSHPERLAIAGALIAAEIDKLQREAHPND